MPDDDGSGYSGFFGQFTQGGDFDRFVRLDGALDKLTTRQRMFERKNLAHHAARAKHNRTYLGGYHSRTVYCSS